MKIFKKSEYNYSKLSRLTYIKGVFITAGAVLIIFLLRLLSRGHLADRIAEWIARQFSLSDFQAEMAGLLYSAVTAEEADLEASRQFISDKRDIGQEIIDVAPGLDELT